MIGITNCNVGLTLSQWASRRIVHSLKRWVIPCKLQSVASYTPVQTHRAACRSRGKNSPGSHHARRSNADSQIPGNRSAGEMSVITQRLVVQYPPPPPLQTHRDRSQLTSLQRSVITDPAASSIISPSRIMITQISVTCIWLYNYIITSTRSDYVKDSLYVVSPSQWVYSIETDILCLKIAKDRRYTINSLSSWWNISAVVPDTA